MKEVEAGLAVEVAGVDEGVAGGLGLLRADGDVGRVGLGEGEEGREDVVVWG